ncbi:WD repeat-containing protein 97-like [Narcine bancroftii]|uniref:WD repeat-containing protein 97-like n=1 Tax=Narcine bancroftii TaxID=1343680 RepID=UPI0038316B22
MPPLFQPPPPPWQYIPDPHHSVRSVCLSVGYVWSGFGLSLGSRSSSCSPIQSKVFGSCSHSSIQSKILVLLPFRGPVQVFSVSGFLVPLRNRNQIFVLFCLGSGFQAPSGIRSQSAWVGCGGSCSHSLIRSGSFSGVPSPAPRSGPGFCPVGRSSVWLRPPPGADAQSKASPVSRQPLPGAGHGGGADHVTRPRARWLQSGSRPSTAGPVAGIIIVNTMEPVQTLPHKGPPIISPHRDDQKLAQDKAQRMWSVLSAAVHQSIEKVKRSDWKPLDLGHGLQHVQRVKYKRGVQHVTFNIATKEVVCLLSNTHICVYSCDGRKTRELRLQEPLEGIVHANLVNRYVGWNRCPQVKVLSTDFQTLSITQAQHGITCCCYSRELNLVVTAGAGNLCSWRFSIGCGDLACSTAITDGLTEGDLLTHLVLERTSVSGLTVTCAQRCYAVCGTGVAAFDLTKGILLSYEKHLHDRNITGIAFMEPLRCVITSCQDGNIKIWDQTWNLQMAFIGHRGPVTAIATYPDGPCLLSASKDGTLRVWSLEMADQVDEIQVGMTITELGTEPGHDHIFSCAQQRLDFWMLAHLYRRHTSIGCTVTAIHVSSIALASFFPVRAACACADGAVQLVSPETGDIISTLLLEGGQQPVGLDYCLPREAVLVLTDQGDLLKGNSLTNPMEVLLEVPWSGQPSPISCFCIYMHLVNVRLTHTRWQQAVAAASEEQIRPAGTKDADRYLLISGHVSGLLSVLDWRSGNTRCKVQAHQTGKVLTLVSDPENQRLFSSGLDCAVKVWRVFPYAQDSLSLLMSFFGVHLPTHLCLLKDAFAVALQNVDLAVHSIVLYGVRKRMRKDHHPDHDHQDKIIGLCSCPEMEIFASIDNRGTLKIWDRNNHLIRNVHLKAAAFSMAFCNNRGDLLLGIGNDLHRMNSDQYLPQTYLLQMACQDQNDPLLDEPLPISETVTSSLPPSDLRRLGQAHSVRHRPDHVQITPEEPDEGRMTQQKQQKEAYALLEAREREIRLIQQGEVKSRKKPPHTKEIAQEGFRRYLRLLYGETPRFEIPEDESDGSGRPPPGPAPPYSCPRIRKGFFPILAVPKPWDEVTDIEKEARGLPHWARYPEVPIALDGFIPNSEFLRLLWPMEPWDPTDDLGSEPGIPAVQKLTVEPEVEPKIFRKQLQADRVEIGELQAVISRGTGRVLEPVDGVASASPQEWTDVETPSTNIKTPSPDVDALIPDVKTHSPEVEAPEDQVNVKLPATDPRASHICHQSSLPLPVVPTTPPVPAMVTQFQDEPWFTKVFPNINTKTFPQDLTPQGFVMLLIDQLRTAEYSVKVEITKVLVRVLADQPPDITRLAHQTLMAILNGSNPPRVKIGEQREFICAALWVLKELIPHSQGLLLELMVQFLQSDAIQRNTVKAILGQLGLYDPRNYFEEEVNSWNVGDDHRAHTKEDLRSICQAWLRKWKQKFKALRQPRKLRQTQPQTPRPLETMRPIDVLNYFCELQLERTLMEVKAAEEGPEAGEGLEAGDIRNTVLFLPQIPRDRAILRLGETRSSVASDKLRMPPLSLPPLTFAMGRVIRLPVCKVSLNPFPSPVDQFPLPTFLTLGWCGQKYFIPDNSTVTKYH